MKILQLDLIAFGPFSDRTLDFSPGNHGVHIVSGRNEAGKSSALRALINFFYGIPVRTTDNFLHDHDALKIGARLHHSNGQQRYLIRRKGQKNTLLDESGSAVQDDEIKMFLDGVPQAVFENMYGINFLALKKGGNELVRGQGEIGTTLFSAASGLPEIRDVLARLETQADELFKPRGSTQTINRLIREYEELKKQRKEATLSARDWTELAEHIRDKEQRRTELARQIAEKQGQLSHKRRLFESSRDAGEIRELSHEIQRMGPVISLAEDFSIRRSRIEEKLREAREALDKDSLTLDELRSEIGRLVVPNELINQKNRITDLFQDSGNYKQGKGQLPSLKGRILEMEREGCRILRDLNLPEDPKNIAKHCLSVQIRSGIEDVAGKYRDILSNLNHQEESFSKLERTQLELTEKLHNLAKPLELGDLDAVLNECRQSGLTEKNLKTLETQLKALEDAITAQLSRLGLARLTRPELLALAVPAKKSLKSFEKKFQDNEKKITEQQRLLENEKRALAGIDRELMTLRTQGSVPTEADLIQGRSQRDALWQMIKRGGMLDSPVLLEENLPTRPVAANLGETFENSLKTADDISDRLRRESDRVAKLAQLMADRASHVTTLAEISQGGEVLGREKLALQAAWSDLWQGAGISPKNPEEMIEWHDLYEDTLKICQDWQRKSGEREQIAGEIQALRQALAGRLVQGGTAAPADSLASLCRQAEALLKSQGEMHFERKQLEKQLGESEKQAALQAKKLTVARQALADWNEQWLKVVGLAGLNPDASPEQARAVIEKFKDLTSVVKDMEEKNSRIRAIESDCRRFEQQVASLCADLGRVPGDQAPALLIAQLNEELKTGLIVNEQLKASERKKGELEKNLRNHQNRLEKYEAALRDCLKEAECEDPALLPEREERSRLYRKRQERVGELKRILSRSAGSLDLDEFMNEIAQADIDQLPQDMAELEKHITTLEQQLAEINQDLGGLLNEQKRMTGGSRSAEIAEEIESVLANIRDSSRHYTGLTLAVSQMRAALERYRKENQGPVLTRAGDFFRRITVGRFEGLTTDYGSDDQPILVGLRHGRRIPIEGMSEGTCDQLYLALRLASLEQRLQQREPLPLILDDVLVNFDDARIEQTFQVLAELSRLTQIIIFTHHEHLVELARRCLGPAVLYTQAL